MRIKDIKAIIAKYPDDEACLQINVSDGNETIGLTEIKIDEQYEKEDGLVLTVNLEEGVYFKRYAEDEADEVISKAYLKSLTSL